MRLSSFGRSMLFTVAATLALPALAQSPLLEVGSPAPAVELTAADGARRSLAAGDGPKVLIFYRGLW